MGKAPIPTIVGGGIALVPGIVGQIGEYFFVSSIIPPEGTTSNRFRIIASATPDQLVAETEVGREDTTIGIGSSDSGIAAGSLRPDAIYGRNIVISHANVGANNAGVFIGQGIISAPGSGAGNVIISSRGLTPTLFNSDNVIITGGTVGQNSVGSSVIICGNSTGGVTSNFVVIGQGANANANGVTIVGQGASASQANNVSIGQAVSTTAVACIAIGQGHGCPNRDMIKIGHGGSNAGTAGQILIGNGISPNAVGTNEICLGHEGLGGGAVTTGLRLGQNQGVSGAVVAPYPVQWKSALGTDIAAGSVTFIAPKATGNAVAGSFIFQTSPPLASGATLQTAATRLTISPNGVSTFAAPTAAAENIVIEGFGGAGQASIRLNNLTTGAGVAAGTLTNAPTAGDPAFWIPVNIAGAVRFIPAWA